MKVSKEFKTGLVVVLAIALLFLGINFLKGNALFGKNQEYYAVYGSVNGLGVSNSVSLNGVKVGTIKEIYLHPNDASKVVVKFGIDQEGLLIPEYSVARITSSDLLGTKVLNLELNRSDSISNHLANGDTLIGAVDLALDETISAELLPVKNKLEKLMGNIDKIVYSVNAFWDTSAAYTLDASLYQVRDAIENFGKLASEMNLLVSGERERLGRIFANVESITSNLKTSNEQVRNIIGNVEKFTDTLVTSEFKQTITNAKDALASVNTVMKQVANGEGTIGKLLHDDSLYNGLLETNHELQDLVKDIQVHPERYIHFSLFGKKVKGVQLTPEEEKAFRKYMKDQGVIKP